MSAKEGAAATASEVMPLQRSEKGDMSERSAGRTRVEKFWSSVSFLGHTNMAPNSRIAKPCPGRVGTVVSTSKNTISDRSSFGPIATEQCYRLLIVMIQLRKRKMTERMD